MRAVEKLLTSKRLLAHISRDYTPVAMYQTFCPEDLVLAHLIFSDLVHSEYNNIHMFTIDTGRTSDEIYQCIDSLQKRYGKVLRVYHPDSKELEMFGKHYGFGNDYYQRSWQVRFGNPLARALEGYNAWISTRNHRWHSESAGHPAAGNPWIKWDGKHQVPCFNPLSRWTQEEIQHYARHHGLSFVDRFLEPPHAARQFVGRQAQENYTTTVAGVRQVS